MNSLKNLPEIKTSKNFMISLNSKIDQYESKLMYFITDQGREKMRHLLRKEIKNSIDNEYLLKEEDRILVKQFLEKLNKELNY